jgi:hypothetical protein
VLDRFSWKSPVSYFMKVHPVGATLMHVHRQTNIHDTAVGTVHNYASMPKNENDG